MTKNVIEYNKIAQQLRQQNIGMTPAELHGLITGLLTGNNHDSNWRSLLDDMVNDGQAIKAELATSIDTLYTTIKEELYDNSFAFQLLLDSSSIYTQIDDLAAWINHFLLGLGLMVPHLDNVKGESGEALADLKLIASLGYDEDEDVEELTTAFEELMEFTRVVTIYCHDEFNTEPEKPILH